MFLYCVDINKMSAVPQALMNNYDDKVNVVAEEESSDTSYEEEL